MLTGSLILITLTLNPKRKWLLFLSAFVLSGERENLGVVNFNRMLVQHLKIEALNFPLGQEKSVLLSVEHSAPQNAFLERCALPSWVE